MRFAVVATRLATMPGALPPPAEVLMPVVLGGGPERRTRREPPPGRTPRDAAVLVLLYPDTEGETRVVLIERTQRGHHAGEVSFPGGRAEPGDPDPVATALREAGEEVGLDPDAAGVRVVGQLERFWIPISDFAVTPVVALADRPPVLVAQPSEVSRILEPPVAMFLPDAPVSIVERRSVGGWDLRYGHFPLDGLSVWGATARILSQLGLVLVG